MLRLSQLWLLWPQQAGSLSCVCKHVFLYLDHWRPVSSLSQASARDAKKVEQVCNLFVPVAWKFPGQKSLHHLGP